MCNVVNKKYTKTQILVASERYLFFVRGKFESYSMSRVTEREIHIFTIVE